MRRKNITKGIVLIVAVAGVFYLSIRFQEFLLDFLMVAIADPVTDSECIFSLTNDDNAPYIATTALDGTFRMAFKTALFLATVTAIILINASVGLFFAAGVGFAYVLVRYGIVSLCDKEAIFQLEKYVDFVIAFMFLSGALFSLIYYVVKGAKKLAMEPSNGK